MQRIRKELFPDIQYENETICTSGEDSPLVRVLEQEKYKGKIVVSGEGSIGKSTMLTDLRIRLLAKERAYVYFNLRDLNVGIDYKSVKDLVNNYEGNDLIVILDSYDETSISPYCYGGIPRKTAEKLIEYCADNDKVALLVVGVRQGCKTTKEMRVEQGGFSATQGFRRNQENAEKQYLEFDKWAQEKGFSIAKLQRFSDEKIDLILSERKGVSKELRKLLKNTMFLSMFLEDPVLDWESATNEAKFIDKYFEEVFCNKLEYQPLENREIIKEKLFSTICDIGENVFNGFCQFQLGSKEVKFGNRTELNTFFKQEQRGTEWIITATQEKYLSYCVAKYLAKRMPGETIKENEGIIQAISELCGKNESVREESLYFAGQLLDKNKICIVNDALHKTKNEHLFRSLSLILLGSNNGEIKYKKTAITRFSRFVFVNSIYLKTLTLPENIEYINIGICEGCDALKHIAISEDNKKYKSIDENLYSKDGKELIRYAPGKQEEAFTIPPCVETIGTLAFTRCKYIQKITIPGSVKVIDRGAFFGCESLEEIVISEGVEAIMGCAFDGCRSLSNIIIPASVKDIGWSAFDHCDLLSKIVVDESNDTYKSIDGNLYSKDGKKLIRYAPGKQEAAFNIPSHVETIAEFDHVFLNCKYIKKITIPGSVKVIDRGAFSGCESLEEIVISEGVEAIMERAFDGCRSLSNIIIPASVKDIGWSAFDHCDLLSQIDVDESNDEYKSIDGNLYSKDGKELIRYAPGKQEEAFTIPPCVETIGTSAFTRCKYIKKITIPGSVKVIDRDAFSDCESLEEVVISEGVEAIMGCAFDGCRSLSNIIIPASVKDIGWSAFDHCDLLSKIVVDESNDTYKSIDGNLYSKDGKKLIRYAPGKQEAAFNIPSHVETIAEFAHVFLNCKYIKKITIPGSVKVIDRGAFSGCESLEEIVISEGVEAIMERAFDGCRSLSNIIIPASVKVIDRSAFDHCDLLSKIVVDESNDEYKSIDGNLYSKDGKELIRYAPGKQEAAFKIPFHVETIAEFAFSRHDQSTLSVLMTALASQIKDEEALYVNFNINDRMPLMLKNIFIPSSVGKIEKYAFMDCEGLKVYYGGTHKDWVEKKLNENVELDDADIYFYSETHPEESGDYWHFGEDGKTPVIW